MVLDISWECAIAIRDFWNPGSDSNSKPEYAFRHIHGDGNRGEQRDGSNYTFAGCHTRRAIEEPLAGPTSLSIRRIETVLRMPP